MPSQRKWKHTILKYCTPLSARSMTRWMCTKRLRKTQSISDSVRTATCKDSNEEADFNMLKARCEISISNIFSSILKRALASSAASATCQVEIFWIKSCMRQQLEKQKLELGVKRGMSQFVMSVLSDSRDCKEGL